MSEPAQGLSVPISPYASLDLDAEACLLDLSQRVAALSASARTFHRMVLRAFLNAGHAPTLAELRPAAGLIGIGLEHVLSELVIHDVIQRATDGTLEVVYPFSSRPTPHLVQIEEAPPVFAMCVIDALGLPFMVGRPAIIATQDPTDATPITIAIEPASGVHTWLPSTVVVVVNEHPKEPIIKADCVCPFINAFVNSDTAARWRAEHPELHVHLLTQEQALAEAHRTFGALLEEPSVAE
jgi:hypothetical protein